MSKLKCTHWLTSCTDLSYPHLHVGTSKTDVYTLFTVIYMLVSYIKKFQFKVLRLVLYDPRKISVFEKRLHVKSNHFLSCHF